MESAQTWRAMAQNFYLSEAPPAAHHVYVGAVHEGSPAIFRLLMDAATGQLRSPGVGGAPELVAVVPEDAGMGGPWIAVHPSEMVAPTQPTTMWPAFVSNR